MAKKYIDAEKLRKDIEKERKNIDGLFIEGDSSFYDGQDDAYNHTLSLIDSLQQEQQEEPDKSLEEEVKNYFQGYWPGTETAEQCNTDLHFTPPAIMRLARHFAEWQKEQFEKNRLANCDALSKEDYDRETDFAMEIIEKEHRHPTFTDAINYGMRLQAEKDKDTIELAEEHAYFAGAVNEREKMMKEAVEGYIDKDHIVTEGPFYYIHSRNLDLPNGLKEGDKVKLIIVKEDE